jgi:allantoate deiminase
MASDLDASARRIAADVEALTGDRYTAAGPGITRYAYTDEYAATLDYFRAAFEDIGFAVWFDPVGTLVASNVGPGERAFGLGSHCDSNRNGGPWDGTLGVVCALEACRIAGDALPLRAIAFLEEEASGFGQMLLGSRIVLGAVSDEELASYRDEHGIAFLEAAASAGYRPDEIARAGEILDGLVGWIELHIEQGRVLQDTGGRLGVVDAIAGYVHADVTVRGRADHAGATPMDFRLDPGPVVAECILELERLARAAGNGTVGTVGELEVHPSLINAIPERIRMSLDIRGVDEPSFQGVARDIAAFAEARGAERGLRVEYRERQRLPATPLDRRIVAALTDAAAATGEPHIQMPSGAAHDTMCVADRVPSAMVFVPCMNGISHSPAEDADPADAALAAGIILEAIRVLT